PVLVSVVDALASGPVPETPQDENASTYAPRLVRDDGAIDWSRPALSLHNLIRGLHPWPHAFTYHVGRRLILLRSHVVDEPGPAALALPTPAGTILEAGGDRLHIATGGG